MSNTTRRKKLLIWFSIPVLLLALVLCLISYNIYVGVGGPNQADFTGFRPNVLPSGVTIIGQTLTRYKEAGMDIWYFQYALNLNTHDLAIYEYKQTDSEPSPISCRGIGSLCQMYQTPNRLDYRVSYGEYQGKAFSMSVEWIQRGTRFDMVVNDKALTKYLHYDWTPMMSSMQPVNLSRMSFIKTVHKSDGG